MILLFFLMASGRVCSCVIMVTVLPPNGAKKRPPWKSSRQIEHDISELFVRPSRSSTQCSELADGYSDVFPRHAQSAFCGARWPGQLHFIPFLGAVVGISVVTLVAAITLDGLGAILLHTAPAYFFPEYPGGVCGLAARDRAAFVTSIPSSLLVWLIFWGWLWRRAGRADGSAAVGHRQNNLRPCRGARPARRVYRTMRLAALAFAAADQDHRADDQAGRK